MTLKGQILGKVIVVKIGGSTLGSQDTTVADIVELQRRGKPAVIIHGGGKLITEWLAKQGVPAQFIQGERVTDRATLDVVTAVLAGLVNKEIVAEINSLGGKAIGISGADGALIEGEVKDAKLGYVGAVTKVNIAPLEALLRAGYVPVVAPVSLNARAKPDEPQLLNVNADFVAGEIAAALGAERLVFLTDVVGICGKSGKLLPKLSPAEAETLIASGVASGGMIPKIRACLRGLSGAATACIIDGRQPHTLLKDIEGAGAGTVIQA
ncbi:MAG: acetylglutamate kinase [Chloroflexi bacterium]|nr:acetylglutamate kinase [Chloroflexota bacterium]